MTEVKPTVLYLDDEVDNLNVFKAAFRRDFRVITTTSPLEALDILEKEEIPVIITDQRMPGMTGTEFLDAIPEKNKAIKMILTGFTDMESLVYAINKCNLSQYITKPWDRNKLKIVIEHAIQKFEFEKNATKMLSELKETNESFKTENEKLQNQTLKEKLRAKSLQEFVGMISHELRTPMNGIINIANLSLLDKKEKSDIDEESLQQIINSSEELLEIIEKLKEKIESDAKNNIVNIPFNIYEVFSLVLNKYTESNKNPDLKIVEEHFDKQYINKDLIGNPESIWLIIDNLMSNAVKFTDNGFVKLKSSLVSKNDNYIEILIEVIDTGKGIDLKEQKRILSLFTPQKKSIKSSSPLDIGLPLVKRLIKSNNSQLSINSELGKGSTFSFSMKFAYDNK